MRWVRMPRQHLAAKYLWVRTTVSTEAASFWFVATTAPLPPWSRTDPGRRG
jgi:hypothetical protein